MNRLDAITDALRMKGVDGIIVSDLRNIRYLSGFAGSSACLLLTERESIFFTDFRYEEQARREIRGFDIIIEKEERPRAIIEKARESGIKLLGFESTASYAFYRSLLRKGLKVKAVSNLVEDLRRIKDNIELKNIKKAIERAEDAFLSVKSYIRPGISEKLVALLLEENLKKSGCSSLPFDIIVASGVNSALPHAQPSENKIKEGDLVVIDWGGESGGYFSDMTRTFLMAGKNISKKKEIYDIVLEANNKAIGAVSDGTHVGIIDRTAREVIKKAGYADFFGHGTGHGVGLDVHELPRISRTGRELVRQGMVFTVEPGIYIPGLGGVRIEDMVVVGKNGRRVLTSLPKGLEIIH